MFEFKIESTSGKARAGTFSTPHGEIKTPVFMPCGTKATVKTLDPIEVKNAGCQILLGNTYHLHMRPGSELIEKHGGLHKFMKWDSPILTDSGGFQVFSLGRTENNKPKITDDGVEFYSHLDGSKHFFSPDKAIQIQKNLGADIIMAFDECAPGDSSHAYAKQAMERTHKWAVQSVEAFKKYCDPSMQTIFPIVQGVIYPDLREESAKFIAGLDTAGIAIGGLSVGESKENMYGMIDVVIPHLPDSKPRYLMGVGSPEDLIEGVYRGIDMFDCVLPTRIARHGAFWTKDGRQNLMNSKYRENLEILEEGCDCSTCLAGYSSSYIAHLIREKEVYGMRLLSIHNLRFLFRLMEQAREAIINNEFEAFRKEFYKRWR
jgi:queuine tRNA-ribosyltransferase